jgi:predicted transcriptional regulator of viral defense system
MDLPEALRQRAEEQCGVVSRDQAIQAGAGKGTIRTRISYGRWQRLYPGIYATFTGEPSRTAMLWAALLHAGPGAVLSYQTAAALSGLTYRSSELIHITVPRSRRVLPVPDVVIHRSARAEQARHPALLPPRTRIEETVLDLAGAAQSFDDAFGWVSAACAGRLTTPDRILAAMEQRPKVRDRGELRLALGDVAAGAHTVLEYRYLNDVERGHGLPQAIRQARSARGRRTEYRDILYREYRVVVETDGRQAHPDGSRWRDVQRDNAAATLGLITLRYSWTDVTSRPCWVAAQVGLVLAGRGWSGRMRLCGPACQVAQALTGAA